ncbi:hypothetical protein ACJMK2_012734 [Sinanodonta woodiana]|uniref:Uncharacterized protein n=1 Tax=Sinanodonta woodiana TaxID=1069815 RepID=A0ABD3VB41_SINWO
MNSLREKTYLFVISVQIFLLCFETNYMIKKCLYNKCGDDLNRELCIVHNVNFRNPTNILDSRSNIEWPKGIDTHFSGKSFREVPMNLEFEKGAYFLDDNKMNFKNTSWCLVVVADIQTQSRESYMTELGGKEANVVFLEPDDHGKLYPAISNTLPWKHFGRKNIGYIYAIHHGAEYIWDFDDDNMGLIDLDMFAAKTNFKYNIPCSGLSKPMINPYPYFGVKETYSWPRGFPLEEIRNPAVTPDICHSNASLTIGVIQSLANKQPDVDAIYRLTRDNPFDFNATVESQLPLIIPNAVFTPFNAQATLWAKPAFLYLPLPISVDGRVTDIWKSYFAEYFFHRLDIKLIFSPPYVGQDRNPHNLLKDLKAENDLYMRSNMLINILSELLNNCNSLGLQNLYDELYKRGYIELEDLKFIRAWVKTVEAIYAKSNDIAL